MTIDLEKGGWRKFYECNCDGSLRQHFENKAHKGFEIVIRPTKNTFRIKMNGQLIGGPFWGYELKQKMAELIK
jgi:hypothetical protein